MKTLLTFLFSLIICGTVQSQTQKIELNLNKGQAYTQKTIANSTIKQTVNGKQTTIEMVITGKMKFFVTDFIGGIYSMDVSYESLAMKMTKDQSEY